MNRASRTAEYMAFFRALESARPVKTRLFSDAYAARFLPRPLSLIAAAAQFGPLNAALSQFLDSRWPGARTSGIARTRYIDDLVLEALNGGIEQVVILGAGFDARAYRFRQLANIPVFEVDHAATSRRKRAIVEGLSANAGNRVTFVDLDFNETALGEALLNAGFDPARRALFLWEGVTNYLNESAVDTTLRFVATCAAGSRMVFTYIDRAAISGIGAEFRTTAARDLVRSVGEPWTFGLDPASVPVYLAQRGLVLRADLAAPAYRARYLRRRSPAKGYEFYHVATADVAALEPRAKS